MLCRRGLRSGHADATSISNVLNCAIDDRLGSQAAEKGILHLRTVASTDSKKTPYNEGGILNARPVHVRGARCTAIAVRRSAWGQAYTFLSTLLIVCEPTTVTRRPQSHRGGNQLMCSCRQPRIALTIPNARKTITGKKSQLSRPLTISRWRSSWGANRTRRRWCKSRS